jgi:hypothetical protein
MPFENPLDIDSSFKIPNTGTRFDTPDGLPELDDDTYLETIIKGAARGFRTVPKAVSSVLEKTVGENILTRELERGEKFVTGKTNDPTKVVLGEIAAGIGQVLSVFPLEGAAVPLLAVSEGLDTFDTEVAKGTSTEKAATLGLISTAAVVVTEAPVWDAMLKGSVKPVRRLLDVAVKEVFGENLENIIGHGAQTLVKGEELPSLEQLAKEAKLITMVSLGTSAFVSPIGSAHSKAKLKREKIKSEAEADLALHNDKANPQPIVPSEAVKSPSQAPIVEPVDSPESFENERTPADLTDNGEIERGKRELFDIKENKDTANKSYKQLVKEGIITEKTDRDIGKIEAQIMFMHNKIKKFPILGPIYKEGLRFMRATDNTISKYGNILDPFFKLSKKSKKNINNVLIKEHLELGRKLTADELVQSFTREELEGYAAMRNVSKVALDDIGNMMLETGASQEDVASFKASMEDTWIPLSRFGDNYVAVNDRAGNLINYSFHKNKQEQRKEAVKWAGQGNINVGEVKKVSDELVKDMPVTVLSALKRIDDKLGLDITKAYGAAMEFGFPTHLLQQKKIKGFDEDIGKSMSNYLIGLAKYTERRKSRRTFAKQIAAIDPKAQGRLHEDATKYAEYVTGSTNELSKFRQFLFRYYLGGNLKSALLNATQTLTTTFPALSKYTSAPSIKLAKAGKIATQSLESIKRTDPDLADALTRMIYDGVLSEQFVTMLRGEAYKNLRLNNVDAALSFFFNHVEVFNRKLAGIAAYKAATGEGVRIRDVDGKKRKVKLSHEEAIAFAESFIDETQFNYTKADRPRIARGLAAPAFTFRLFAGNYLSMLKNFLAPPEAAGLTFKEKVEHVEFGAMARAMGTMMALGGLTAIPGLKDLEKALEAAGYDPRKTVRDNAGKYGDFLLHGGLFPAGVDISGAVGTVEMVPNDAQQGAWPAVAGIILGVPTDIPKRINRAFFFAHELKDPWRAVEAIMPEAVRNPMVAMRWVKQGAARTPFGEPIAKPGLGSVLLKAIAVQPAILTKAYEREHSERLLNERSREVSKNLSFMIARAIFNKNEAELQKILMDISKHNESVKSPENLIIINQRSIKESLANMIYPEAIELKRLPKKARQEFLNIQQTFGGSDIFGRE